MASLNVKIPILDGPSSEDMYTSMRMRDLRHPYTVIMNTVSDGPMEIRILSMEVDTQHEHGYNAWKFSALRMAGRYRHEIIAGYFSTSTRKGMITHMQTTG